MLSDNIVEQRRGSITASEAHSIMAGWDTPRPTAEFPIEIYDWINEHEEKPLVSRIKSELNCDVNTKLIDAAWQAYKFDHPVTPQGLITYAEKLACEELFDDDPSVQITSQHMENGNEREVEATELLIQATGIPFKKTGEDQMHVSVNGIGCTPDGVAFDDLDLAESGCEIKARSALHHARQILIHDNDSLKDLDFKRFCQIQVGCLVLEVDRWYSASFNPFAKVKGLDFNYCLITRDNEFLEIFKKRAALTFKHKQLFIDKLMTKATKEAA